MLLCLLALQKTVLSSTVLYFCTYLYCCCAQLVLSGWRMTDTVLTLSPPPIFIRLEPCKEKEKRKRKF